MDSWMVNLQIGGENTWFSSIVKLQEGSENLASYGLLNRSPSSFLFDSSAADDAY
jgi:hypothetical protein